MKLLVVECGQFKHAQREKTHKLVGLRVLLLGITLGGVVWNCIYTAWADSGLCRCEGGRGVRRRHPRTRWFPSVCPMFPLPEEGGSHYTWIKIPSWENPLSAVRSVVPPDGRI